MHKLHDREHSNMRVAAALLLADRNLDHIKGREVIDAAKAEALGALVR